MVPVNLLVEDPPGIPLEDVPMVVLGALREVGLVVRLADPLPDAEYPCGEDGCDRSFPTPQGRALHRQSHVSVQCQVCGDWTKGNAVGPHKRVCRGAPLPDPAPSPSVPKPEQPDDVVARRRAAAASAAFGDY